MEKSTDLKSDKQSVIDEVKDEEENGLKRSLKTRHMSMIAIGGTIGTGLFVASGSAIATAGPGGALIAFALTGVMVFFIMTSLGEMATYIPISGSFNTYAARFIDPAFGFALAWNYWYSWAITIATEITAAALIMKFWLPNFPGVVWSAITLGMIFSLNAISVKGYGEAEYWFSMIKVTAIVIFIIIGILTDAGVLGGNRIGFENWTIDGAPFPGGISGVLGTFVVAGFSFQGTELVGVSAGESSNPKKDVPIAIRQTFWRILLFYILSIFLIGLLIPYNDNRLIDASVDNISISPFTIAFEKAGLGRAADVMNAVILVTVMSAGNSGMYACARILWVLANEEKAPRFLKKITRNGIPIYALLVTTLVGALAFLTSFIQEGVVYTWLINLAGVSGLIAWLGISITHWRFRRAYIAQGRNLADLPYRASLYPVSPILAVTLCSIVILGQGYEAFVGGFDVATFFSSYIGVILFLIFFLGYKFIKKTSLIPLTEIDLDTHASTMTKPSQPSTLRV